MLPQKTDIRKPEGKFFRLKDKDAEWKLCLQERTESTRDAKQCVNVTDVFLFIYLKYM